MPSQPDFAEVVVLLGAKVRAVREARGLSQTELANAIHKERKTLQNIEYGRASTPVDGKYGHGNPKLDTIFLIAGALEVDIAYLIDPATPVEPVPV